MLATAVLVFAMMLCAHSFYLPGIEPVPYDEGQRVEIRVNTLRSLSTVVPYSYYHFPLFCPPSVMYKKQESLGEILWGDDIMSSPYYAEMRKDWKCKLLDCPADQNNKLWDRVYILEKLITEGYRGYMNVDNLPAFNNGTFVFGNRCKGQIPANQQYPFMRGYALGVHKGCIGETLVNNHLHFRFQYHQPDLEVKKYTVVGISVTPYSVKHAPDGGDCDDLFDVTLPSITALSTKDLLLKVKPYWSYSVEWVYEPNIRWGSRWDSYLHTSFADTNNRVHWLYIVNSLLITLCLSAIAAMILLRTLHRDFNRYNSPDPDENQEEVGWKLVHADVCRPPPHSSSLAVFVGTGMQLFLMTAFALFFAMLGFLSPANRGGLLTTLILLFVLLSFVAGNICARLLKMFDAKAWKTIFACAFTFPGVSFFAYIIINIVDWKVGASSAIPFTTMLTLFGLWVGISVPLVVLGASFGFHQSTIEHPVKIGKLAREIPPLKWYWSPPFIYIFPAMVPLGAAFLELKFILSSIWQGMVYYVFGFLGLVFMVWTITVSLTTIIVLYYQLCYEDYRWWWRSVFIPGALGAHFFAYSVYYFFTALSITSPTGCFLYFAYMGMVSVAYGVVAGAVGFVAAFFFVHKIYGSIKIEQDEAHTAIFIYWVKGKMQWLQCVENGQEIF